jgi:GH15 family glucan-1,4-alpha-glucosidase
VIQCEGNDSGLEFDKLPELAAGPYTLEFRLQSRASGDRKTAEDLWPLVLKQLDFTLKPVNAEGLFVSPKKWWLFIDWQPKLTDDNKQASEHAIVLFGLRATLKLAEKLGKADEAAFIGKIIPRMEAAARKNLWDDKQGLFISGSKREISWASQAWVDGAGGRAVARAGETRNVPK